MRSIKNLPGTHFLGKWVMKSDWGDTFKCVGISDEFIFVWYRGIHKYDKYDGFIVGETNLSDRHDYHSYSNSELLSTEISYNRDIDVKWYKI